MKILAVDTSTDACSAALLSQGQVLSRYEWAPQRHAELLLPMVDSLLQESGDLMQELDAIAFCRGPGSFTGLRIAAGVVQGLAYAANCPVAPVSSLATLAQGVWREYQRPGVLSSLDARLGEVYWGAYRLCGSVMCPEGDELVCLPNEVPLLNTEAWYGAGSAWSVYSDIFSQRLDSAVLEWDGARAPHARDVLTLAEDALRRGAIVERGTSFCRFICGIMLQPGRIEVIRKLLGRKL